MRIIRLKKMAKDNFMNYDALRDYIKKSEMRIVNDNFRIRMSPEIAQKYDAGEYETGVAEHTTCINELLQLNLQELIGKQPIFYTYLVPDDRLGELLNFPYKGQRGGRPVDGFDKDGFNALNYAKNFFFMDIETGEEFDNSPIIHLLKTAGAKE